MQKKFNETNAGLIQSMRQTKLKNAAMIKTYRKNMENSVFIIVGIIMVFIAIHDFNRWPEWSTYAFAIVINGAIAGGIAFAYWLWKKPKTEEPEKEKLNQLAKAFLIDAIFQALFEKLKQDGYTVMSPYDSNSLNDLISEGKFIKEDGTLIDGQVTHDGKITLMKDGIKFVLTKWMFNGKGFNVEARVTTGAITI